ncbi:MAG TPA: RagB/SusD family nutrient uptake outer membrane protein, partial [Niastella sp.]
MKLHKINPLYIFLICAFVLTTVGCKKWLREEDNDPSNLSPDNYYTLPGHADAAIAAAYAQTRFIGNGAGIFANNFSMLEMPTGLAKTETGQNTDLNNLIGLSYNGENVFVLNWWTGLYSVIAQTNLVLDKVPGIKMDEAKKKQVLGEAQFLRAWSYFYLVRLWGDVPLHTTSVLTATDPKVYSARTPKDSIYMQIVSDLKAAEGSGLPWTDGSGRASLGAVKSLLAEVYLTMAGYPINKSEYYKLAADKANEVITSGKFSLFGSYNNLHDETLENQGEQIFEIQYLGGVANNGNQAILLPNFKDVSAYGTEIGSTTPHPLFVNSFEAGDLRTVDRQGFFYTSYYS